MARGRRKGRYEGDKTVRENRKLLISAFMSLKKVGVLARANHLCCSTCASSSVGADVDARKMKGGAFWHGQDEDSIWDDGGVYVGFFSRKGSDEGAVEIAQLIVAEVRKRGLKVDWDGTPGRRIYVDLKVPVDGELVDRPEPPVQKAKKRIFKLRAGENAFGVMGDVKRGLVEAGIESREVSRYFEEATKGDYAQLLATSRQWLERAGYVVR